MEKKLSRTQSQLKELRTTIETDSERRTNTIKSGRLLRMDDEINDSQFEYENRKTAKVSK